MRKKVVAAVREWTPHPADVIEGLWVLAGVTGLVFALEYLAEWAKI